MKLSQKTKSSLIMLAIVAGLWLLQYFGILDLNNKNSSKYPQKNYPNKESKDWSKGDPPPNMVKRSLSSRRLVYTRHAECRMDCREISEEEVLDILRNGTINERKSKQNDRPCPTYALEGYTKDKQEVRIVFAQCDNATKVITAIDLGRKYDCYCK